MPNFMTANLPVGARRNLRAHGLRPLGPLVHPVRRDRMPRPALLPRVVPRHGRRRRAPRTALVGRARAVASEPPPRGAARSRTAASRRAVRPLLRHGRRIVRRGHRPAPPRPRVHRRPSFRCGPTRRDPVDADQRGQPLVPVVRRAPGCGRGPSRSTDRVRRGRRIGRAEPPLRPVCLRLRRRCRPRQRGLTRSTRVSRRRRRAPPRFPCRGLPPRRPRP